MKNLSLNKKISLIISLFVLALITICVLGIRGLSTVNASLHDIVEHKVVRVGNASAIRATFRAMGFSLFAMLSEENKESRGKLAQQLDRDHADFLKLFEKSISDASEQMRPNYEKVQVFYMKWWEYVGKAEAARNNGSPYMELYLEAKRLRLEGEALLDDMVKTNNKLMTDAKNHSDELYNSSRNLMLLVGILATLLCSALAFVVLRATSKKIQDVIHSLRAGSNQVSSAAQQIASSSEELSQAATEQAASLEETAASIEEMNSMVAKNSENANSASSTSQKSQGKAAEGKAVVEKMIESMEAINRSNGTIMDQVNRSNESMAGIIKVIEEIGQKTKVINDIVFQTKLLSFNASVEAARAGEHGKGFAVVAEEVGNLAQMSGNAAKEISTLLEDSVNKVTQIVQETKTSVEQLIAEGKETVEKGTEVARQCGEVLEDIVVNVSSVTTMASEIATASAEQSRGCAEVTKAMTQVDQATQQNAATSEECASASEELAAQAEVLQNTVKDLIATVLGANAAQTNETFTPEKKTPPKPKAQTANVVPMKKLAAKHAATAAPPLVLKKASGQPPPYDHAEFEEV
jgi:methyl-accepting chemotaxis protein